MGIDPTLSAVDAAEAGVAKLFAMNRELGIPAFSQVDGVREEDFQAIAEKAKSNISDASNAKPMTIQSYLEVIRTAFNHVA